MLANQRSVGSQEYAKTPDDSGGEEEERPRMILKKSSIKLVEDEQIKEDLDNSIEKMKNNLAAHRLGPMEEVNFKRDSLKKDSMKARENLKDKTRLILLTRMYRIEKEKVNALQTDIMNLQNEVIAGKENIEDYQKKMEELTEKIKEVEKKRKKCIHKVCPICGDQANREEEEEEEPDGESANQGSLNKSDLLSGEDAPQEGDGEDDDPATRSKRSLRKKTKQPTVGTLPEFNKKKQKKDPKVNPAIAIIASIKETGMKKFKNFMAIKGVLKHIFTLYSDRSRDNMIDKDEEFPSFVYNWFLNNFGFKKLAEQKFIVFLLSVKKYLYVVRINLFARFMGLLDGSSNYNLEELNKYLEAIEYTSKLNLGSPIQNNETDTKHYIAFLKAADYVKYFSETKMPLEEYMEFRRSIEIIKETDPKGINRNGILDFDLMMTKVLAKYRILCNRTKQNVVTAFKAADLDGNKNCSLKEFITLYRNIEQDKYDSWFAETVFNEHADVKVEGQMHLSFDKFTVVCVEYGLFSDAQQDQFLEVQSEEEILTKLHEMKEEWERRKVSMIETLDIMTKIPGEEVSYWKDILEALGERVTSCEDTDTQEIKPLVIAYKILKQEIEKLREEDMEVDLYGVKRAKTLERSESQAISPLRTEADKKKFFRGMTTVVKSNEAAPKLNKSDTAT